MRILRVVGSSSLPCGCFIGLYETYSGKTVQIVEERAVTCTEPGHRPGLRMAPDAATRPARPASPRAHRPAA